MRNHFICTHLTSTHLRQVDGPWRRDADEEEDQRGQDVTEQQDRAAALVDLRREPLQLVRVALIGVPRAVSQPLDDVKEGLLAQLLDVQVAQL